MSSIPAPSLSDNITVLVKLQFEVKSQTTDDQWRIQLWADLVASTDQN